MNQKQPNQRWPLTAKQQALYDYFVGEGGFHLTKTAEHFGKSLATIHQMLQLLVEKGWLVNKKGKSPAYRPAPPVMPNSACNVGRAPKRAKNKDGWTWRVVKGVMKKSRVGDEIGFTIGRTHWVLRKGDFS
jgi:transposase